MTDAPDMEPAALEAARQAAIGEWHRLAGDRLYSPYLGPTIETAIYAYLAARTTVPEKDKMVDERRHCNHCSARFLTVWERVEHEREVHPLATKASTAGSPSRGAVAPSSVGIESGPANQAYLAAQPVPEAGKAVVKPLEWRDLRGHSFPDMWCAATPCGVYDIEERNGSDSPTYVALGPHYSFIADRDSLEDAKATAQADYEQRILSALVSPSMAAPASWQPIDIAPEDCRVILATAGNWVGEAIMLRDEDTGEQIWSWVDTGKPCRFTLYGWMHLPDALHEPVGGSNG